MNEKYRLTFALCLTALFVTGVVLGAINLANYNTDGNKTNENETNVTEIEAAADTAVLAITAAPEETTIEPANLTTNTIPGFGILATIMFVFFAIYLSHKGR
ncbi:MAG: hypothetical protein C3F06_04420 [Candidatus Methanoperedenaceae archaeon]|nr:MAG: hypothetical protein C3F06_04420 [Candidatus Methanoperedenaceae archaeon]